MISRYRTCLLIGLFLLVSYKICADTSLIKKLSPTIEDFSRWKINIERTAWEIKKVAHSNRKELSAAAFMYIQVQSTVNSLIQRIIRDIDSENVEINREDYEQSFLRSQRAVKDFIDYSEQILLPAKTTTEQVSLPALVAGLTFISATIALTSEVLSIIKYKDDTKTKKEKEIIMKELQSLLLRNFAEIKFVESEKYQNLP